VDDIFEPGEVGSYVGTNVGHLNYRPCNEFINKIEKQVLGDFGNNYEFTHNFTRVYFGKTELTPHIDRVGLDMTLSVTIYNDALEPWPLCISHDQYKDLEWGEAQDTDSKFIAKFREHYTPYNLRPGDGLACTRSHVHWRDPIDLKDRSVIQVFYHWKKK
jgi:hypothetical protein